MHVSVCCSCTGYSKRQHAGGRHQMPRTEDTAGERGSTCHAVWQLRQGAAEAARVCSMQGLCSKSDQGEQLGGLSDQGVEGRAQGQVPGRPGARVAGTQPARRCCRLAGRGSPGALVHGGSCCRARLRCRKPLSLSMVPSGLRMS